MRIAYVIKPLDFVRRNGEDERGWWMAKSPIGDFEIDETRRIDCPISYELIKWAGDGDDSSSFDYDHIDYFTEFDLAVARANGFFQQMLEPYLEDVSDLIEWL